MLGFPIRTSPDQRSVANSPGHIAGSNVLHRLSMPRHPPCALNNLPTTNHQHTQTTMHQWTLWNKPIKRTHKTINSIRNNTTPTSPNYRPRGCNARVHYQEVKQPEANQHQHPTPQTHPCPLQRANTGRQTRELVWMRRLMPQTPNSVPYLPNPDDANNSSHHQDPTTDCVPLVNTPTLNSTFGCRNGCAP